MGPHPIPATRNKPINRYAIMKKKIKMAVGTILFLAGFICSAGQKPDGGPAPLWTLGACLVMTVGGSLMDKTLKDEEGEV